MPTAETGSARTSRIKVSLATARPSRVDARAPARPASANAITDYCSWAAGVNRANGLVNPGICSANVTARQSSLSQRNRRTAAAIRTRCPQTGASTSDRRYPPCVREDTTEHRGHDAQGSTDRTVNTTPPASTSTESTRTEANCGNSNA